MAGRVELEAQILVEAPVGPHVDDPGRPRLVAALEVDVEVAEVLEEEIPCLLRVAPGREQALVRGVAAHAHRGPDDHVHSHARLARQFELPPEVVARRAPHLVGGDVVAAHVPEDAEVLPRGELEVVAVLGEEDVVADVVVGGDEEVAPRIEVGFRLGEREGQHPQHDGNLRQAGLAGHGGGDRAGVAARSGVRGHAHGEPELLEGPGLQRDRLEGGGILEVLFHGPEGVVLAALVEDRVERLRGRDPVVAVGAVGIPDAGVVGLRGGVDPHQVFVVEQQFRRQLQPGVHEVADPAVAVLVPDLDDPQVELRGGDGAAGGAREVAD